MQWAAFETCQCKIFLLHDRQVQEVLEENCVTSGFTKFGVLSTVPPIVVAYLFYASRNLFVTF